jgi:hypothetical protein
MLRSGQTKNVLLSAPCSDLVAFRNGARMIKTFLTWSVTTDENGRASKLPITITRAALVARLAEGMPKFDTSAIIADLNTKLKNNDLGIQLTNQTVGLIEQDADVIYVASLVEQSIDGGPPRKVAGVFGMTAARGLLLSASISDQFTSSGTFQDLLAKVKALMRAALVDNPD